MCIINIPNLPVWGCLLLALVSSLGFSLGALAVVGYVHLFVVLALTLTLCEFLST